MNLNGTYDAILYGLGPMGENLIRNIASKGFRVIGVNRTVEVTEKFAEQITKEPVAQNVGTAATLDEAIYHLNPNGVLFIMVKVNDPRVGDTTKGSYGAIDELFFVGSDSVRGSQTTRIPAAVELAKDKLGIVYLDLGNSHPESTYNRCVEFRKRNLLFLGTGVSGGARGALEGPAIMPGGSREAYEKVAPILEKIAAKFQGKPCCAYVGDNEAGHFVKNVHNGIEYNIMGAISETYNTLRVLLGATPKELQPIFAEWAQAEMKGYLMEITTKILGMEDKETGKPVLDVILDEAGQKGTGKWTSQIAFDLGVPVEGITAALNARISSGAKEERVKASKILEGPTLRHYVGRNRDTLIEAARNALYGSTILAYAQGFEIFRIANKTDPKEYSGRFNFGGLNLQQIAKTYSNGCIIRSPLLLSKIAEAYSKEEQNNLMVAPWFAQTLNGVQERWRYFVSVLTENGLPRGSISASLTHFDDYRTEQSPANMIQALRSFFGEHVWERTDGRRGYNLDELR